MQLRDKRGFTLLEVLAVLVILIGFLLVATLMMRPQDNTNDVNNATRQLALAGIGQGLKEYYRDNKAWPANIPSKATAISDQQDAYDLCKQLIPKYLHNMPLDPQFGIQYKGDATNPQTNFEVCTTADVHYFTGYSIRQNGDSITLTSTLSTLKKFEITIKP
jgi:prepilin-type N-terminal cleavage/methylation domain-containing protein